MGQLRKRGEQPLLRPRKGRMLLGVCAGIANKFGWDHRLTRIGFTLGTLLTGGFGLGLYFVLFLLTPQDSGVIPETIDAEFKVVDGETDNE